MAAVYRATKKLKRDLFFAKLSGGEDAERLVWDRAIEEIVAQCHAEWKNLLHNASISGSFPVSEEGGNERFWEALGRAIHEWINDLRSEISCRWGVNLTFYVYGVKGDTISPADWTDSASGKNFGSFSEFNAIRLLFPPSCPRDMTYHQAKMVLLILRHINQFWREKARGVPAWWKNEAAVMERPVCTDQFLSPKRKRKLCLHRVS